MSGYIETGSARNAASPAITMNADTTIANNGRSMKKFEIMPAPSRLAAARSLRRGAARRGFGGQRHAFHGRAGLHFQDAVHHDALAGRQALVDDDVVARRWRRAAPAASATLSPAPMTHTNEPCTPCMTARFGITSEPASVTPFTRARTTCPGSSAHAVLSSTARTSTVPVSSPTRRRDELDLRALREHARRACRARRRSPRRCIRLRSPRAGSSASASGTANSHVQPVGLHDVREQARIAARGDEAAFGAHFAAREAGDRRAHVGVREIQLRAFAAPLAAAATEASALSYGGDGGVPVAHADELLFVQRHDAIAIARRPAAEFACCTPRSARARAASACERRGVDAEEQVVAFTREPSRYGRFSRMPKTRARTSTSRTPRKLRRVLERELHRTGPYLDRTDLRRWEGRRRRRTRACAETDRKRTPERAFRRRE